MGEYDDGYEHYIDSLILEIEKLQDENDKLREQVSSLVGRSFRTADKMSCIEADNAKLRELVRDYEHCSVHADCGRCEYDGTTSTHCPLSPCFPDIDELRELGVEVDA
jgi:hypothetical protein